MARDVSSFDMYMYMYMYNNMSMWFVWFLDQTSTRQTIDAGDLDAPSIQHMWMIVSSIISSIIHARIFRRRP